MKNTIIVVSLLFSVMLTSCTINVTSTSASGRAADTVDTAQTEQVPIELNATIPAVG